MITLIADNLLCWRRTDLLGVMGGIMELNKIDRVFHTLESRGYECVFYATHVLVVHPNKTFKKFEREESTAEALKNTAKQIAHYYEMSYNYGN